jgi:hypothetical protein
MKRLVAWMTLGTGLALVAGCSGASGGGEGLSVMKNMMRKDTNLRIYLDGHQGKQSALKKGVTGYSAFTVKEDVTTSPQFKYEIIDAKKFGFIKHVSMQVHPKFEADFSDIPDYVIHPKDMNNPDANMKPGVEYDLGNLGKDFVIMDRHDKEVAKVDFKAGVDYMLVFTVAGDKSETTQIFFKTK